MFSEHLQGMGVVVHVEDAGIDKMFGEEVLPDFLLTPLWFSVMGEDVMDADNAICNSLFE